MKSGVLAFILIILTGTAVAQINEKDTTVTATTVKEASLVLRAEVYPDYIQLQWSRGPHDLTGHYELYRSADSINFNIIRQFHPGVQGEASWSEVYRDENPLRGKNYYRLVAVNRFTGERKTVELMTVYKNEPRNLRPTLVQKGRELNILNYDGEELHLLVYSASGAPLFQKVVNSSVVQIPSGQIASGTYIYQLLDRRKYVVNSGKFMIL